MLRGWFALLLWAGTLTASTVACSNNVSDVALFQTAVNAGGTVTVTGTCAFSSSMVSVNNPVTITGSATISGNNSQVLALNADGISISGLTFQAGTIAFSGSRQYSSFSFTNNKVENVTTACGGSCTPVLSASALKNSQIDGNTFFNLWPGGWPAAPQSVDCGNQFNVDCWGIAGLAFASIDQTSITNNTFDEISNDGMHIEWEATTGISGGYTTAGNVIAYNQFVRNRRIPMEIQSQPSGNCPGGCNYSITNTTGLQVKGNYVHDWSFPLYDSWGASLVPDGHINGLFLNNTYVANVEGGHFEPAGGNYWASCQETSGRNLVVQGEVCASDPALDHGFGGAAASTGSNGAYALGAGSGPQYRVTLQNNILCGTANAPFSGQDQPSTAFMSTTIEQYEYADTKGCPAGANLTVSNIKPTAVTTSGSSLLLGLVSNLSIRYVKTYLDGNLVNTQEQQDVNTNFAADRKWLYHTVVDPTTLSTGTHKLQMTATDVSGATNTQSATFAVGTGGSFSGLTAATATATLASATPATPAALSPAPVSTPSSKTPTTPTTTAQPAASAQATPTPVTTASVTASAPTANPGSSSSVSLAATHSVVTASAAPAPTASAGPSTSTVTVSPATPVFQQQQLPVGSTITPNSQLQPRASFTLTAWIECSTPLINYPAFISYGQDLVAPFESYILQAKSCDGNSPLDLYFTTSSSTENQPHLQGTTLLEPGTAYFIAATWDGSTARLYINGILDAAASITGTLAYPTFGMYGLAIGTKYTVDNNRFYGIEEDARVYVVALPQSQIETMYSAGPVTTGTAPVECGAPGFGGGCSASQF